MRIVINDANILIDLFHLDLIKVFFNLKCWDIKTTDFVFDELHEEQKDAIRGFIENKSLILIKSTEEDLNNIFKIHSSTKGLSFTDCSIWYHAKKEQGILLTGDNKLRKQSSSHGVEVRGILFIFDQLLLNNLITFDLAIEKINKLYILNERLPIDAKEQRLESWLRAEHYTSK